MAFLQCMRGIVQCGRMLCTNVAAPYGTKEIQKAVFISQSTDVYTNLALEEWLGTNVDCSNLHIMLYYQNSPCVVVGKDANPWLEVHTSVQNNANEAVVLARRRTVAEVQYHDKGLMNFTFFDQNVPQPYNLGVISRAIFRQYGVSVKNNIENLSHCGMQISKSGPQVTTANYGNSYQNCTLSVNVNERDLSNIMGKGKTTTDKTCMNLCDIAPRVTTVDLLSAIGWEYLCTAPYTFHDSSRDRSSQQRGFQLINPTDEWFPGLKAIRNRLLQWDWCFGNTPRFSIFRTFQVPPALLNNQSDFNELRVKLDVNHGRIADVSLVVPPGLLSSGYTGEAQIITNICGERFSGETLKMIEHFLGLQKCHSEREKFVTECVKRAMVL